ncbi:MAG: VOC family protein [Gaiellaceae bacterium]
MQTVTPYLLYEDVAAAIDWLCGAFGFEERLRFADGNGIVTHAELTLGGGEVFLGHPGPDYRSPRELGAFTHLVHVYVDDVDAHCARAVEAGAPVLGELQDTPYGDRRYDTEDLEGHRWSFAQAVREVAPEDWGATSA